LYGSLVYLYAIKNNTMQKNRIIIALIIVVMGALFFLLNSGDMVQEASQKEVVDRNTPSSVTTEDVLYFEDISGYLATPSQDGTYPGLILIHEWWGLNNNIRELAEQFAEAGYVALAVDLYEGSVTDDPSIARELAGGVRGNMDRAFDHLRAAVSYLEAYPAVQGNRLASVGWCFGGGWSYEMAKNDLGVAASVIYYGRFNPEDDLSIMRATILGHFGENDTSISVDDVVTFQATLKTLSGDHEVFIYPNAGHGFANESSYVPEAAVPAWERTLSFLASQLSGD
jgi:carboxymethylenebutenolidase